MAKKIEMLNDQQEVVHPLTSSDCVIMENGKTLEEVMGDGIATPTVTHEGASFQVGVGDSNIEVVDGDVAGMTLEGQTYQNILPKPTTLIMETDEQEFKINDKIDNNIVLDDNVAEIATIKGQTYVNVVQEESATEYTALGEDLSGQSITTTGKPEGIIKNATLEGMTLVNTIQEPSEANSVVLDLDADINSQSVTINNTVQGGIHGAKINGMTLVNLITTKLRESTHYTDYNLSFIDRTKTYFIKFESTKLIHTIGFIVDTNNWNSKVVCGNVSNSGYVILKPNEDLEVNALRVITSNTVDIYTLKTMIIEYQEGMENWDIPYFDGMKSVEAPSAKTTGKNLSPINTYSNILRKDGNTALINKLIKKNIKISKNKTYFVSCSLSHQNFKPKILLSNEPLSDEFVDEVTDHNNTYLKVVNNLGGKEDLFNTSFTGYEYVHITTGGAQTGMDDYIGETITMSNIQIEEGTQATSYEPYQSSTVTAIGELLPIIETELGCYYDASTDASNGNKLANANVNTVKYNVQGMSKVYVKVAHSNFSFWNSSGAYISGKALLDGNGACSVGYLDVPSNAVYMRCAVEKDKIAEVYNTVTLRKVGDVQDELDLETGKLTQRIEEIVLDGSENWKSQTDSNWNNDIYISFRFILNNMAVNYWDSGKINCISDKFTTKLLNDDSYILDEEFIGSDGTTSNTMKFNIKILRSRLNGNETVVGFKQWLSQNPITLQYHLATPITRQADLSIVDQSNNSLKTIQAQPTLTHITTSSNGLIPFVSIPSQLKYPTIIKPSTQYTLKLNRDVVDSVNQLTVNVGGVSTSITSDVMTITTPSALTSQDIIFTGKNNVVSQLQLIEGDVTGIDYPFFEGMSDVKSPVLIATGKNLVAKTKKGAQDSNGNIIDSNRGLASIDLIKIKNGSTYVLSGYPSPSESYAYALFDKNKNYLNMAWGELLNPIDGVSYVRPFILYNTDMDLSDAYMQLEEGTQATSYEPYKGVTIEQDINSIRLTSDMFTQGRLATNTNEKLQYIGMSYQQMNVTDSTDSNRIRPKSLIKVKPNTTYETIATGITYSGIAFFDKDGLFRNIVGVGSNNSFTTEYNTEYVVACIKRTDDSAINPSSLDSLNLTLQEIPQEIVLRSLPDGVKDTLNLTTGEYVQRIGEVVLDGSAYWDVYRKDYHGVGKSTFQVYCTRDIPKTFLNDKIYCDILCQGDLLTNGNANVNKYPCNYIHNYTDATYTVNRLFVSVNKEMFGCTSNDDYDTCFVRFKAWLEENPITVQYKLATPIIKKVNLTNTTKLPSYASTTHYDTIVPSNSLIPNITLPSTIDYNVAIKPSTQYTVRCNTTDALSVNLGGSNGTLASGKVTLTTPSTLAHNSLKLGSSGKAKEVMVIEGNEIKDNVPFFNGMKNVQMGGIKLVNIARGAKTTALVTANSNKTQFTFTSNGAEAYHSIKFDSTLLKPNTVYTVFMNVITNSSSNSSPFKIQFGHASNNIIDTKKDFTGLFKQAITSYHTINPQDGLAIVFRPATSGNQVVIQNPMIIEGDWTHLDEIPYIESEMIIEQPIIRSQGKNLVLPFNNWEQNNINGITITSTSINGTPSHGGFAMLQKIYLDKDKEYWLSYSTRTGSSCRIRLRKINSSQDVVIANIFTNSTNGSLRVGETGYYYLTIENNGNTTDSIEISNLQLEEGSTATSYEPFKHQTLYSNRVIGYEEGIHYAASTGNKATNANYNSVMADVEGLSVVYITNGSSNYSFWDKDGVYISGKSYLDTKPTSGDNMNGFIAVPSNAKYMKFASGNKPTSVTDYTKATVTGELPLRSLPNGVCDTLNLVTGEYVQRVGEVVLDGRESWINGVESQNTGKTIYFGTDSFDSLLLKNGSITSDKFNKGDTWSGDSECIDLLSTNAYNLRVRLSKTRLVVQDVNGFKEWLSKNPITVQYELKTPIVRKIGLTAKGSYKESLAVNNLSAMVMGSYGDKTYRMQGTFQSDCYNNSPIFTDGYHVRHYPTDSHGDYEYIALINNFIYINILKDGTYNDAIGRQWLSQHPIKVGYISTAQSSTTYSNILKPIFFNNVNVQFMNNNIDIQPTLILQARSTNSYVIDMMKPNTLYTSKFLQSGSGSTFIDGTAISVKPNNTFTSPSTLTNKLMITPLNRQEFMIIEGDVTRFTIPYYKGIRSAYDNVDEIEIYSANKNLIDVRKANKLANFNCSFINNGDGSVTLTGTGDGTGEGIIVTDYYFHITAGKHYTFSFESDAPISNQNGTDTVEMFLLKDAQTVAYVNINANKKTFMAHEGDYCLRFDINKNNTTHKFWNIQLVEGDIATPYQPHKENTTSLPMPTRLETVEVVRPIMEIGRIASEDGQNVDVTNAKRSKDYIPVEPDMILMFMNGSSARAENVYLYDINKNYISAVYTNGTGDLIIPEDCYFIRIHSGINNTSDIKVVKQQYKPIALNSLPNGVKDELIINRATSSAKLIQRVGKVVLDGSENYSLTIDVNKQYTFFTIGNIQNAKPCKTLQGLFSSSCYCDKLPIGNAFFKQETGIPDDGSCIGIYDDKVRLHLHNVDTNKDSYVRWVQENKPTIYYELAEPVVTEIRLKGYPFVYKDGSVELNTEIPHPTMVKYNVNQEHLINGQNETIIRHDKQIDSLYDYIELYLEEEYRMELFRMQLELSL